MVLLAADHSPARALQLVARRIGKKWLDRFDDLAPQMAQYFATAVKDRNDKQMAADLRRAGMTVRFKMTAAMNDGLPCCDRGKRGADPLDRRDASDRG